MKKLIIGIILIAGINIYAQTYNPEKAAEYARFWCSEGTGRRNTLNNNPYIADTVKWGGPYNSYTNNCANFVSQCLKAGGLDLSKGIDPNKRPPQNGVDGKGCIEGVKNLVKHLFTYQEVDTFYKKNGDYHLWATIGDPAFLLRVHGKDTTAWHGYICSEQDPISDEGLFSANTADRCGTNVKGDNQIHFKMKSNYIPSHCTDCRTNAGETDIDCGGRCPPCQQAKSAVKYNYNTSSLPSETRAFESITAGNANIEVLPGQIVKFITAGTIVLQPGFKVHKNGSFTADIKPRRKDVGSDCNPCVPTLPAKTAWKACRNPFIPLSWELAGITKAEVNIIRWLNGDLYDVYNKDIDINQNGWVTLWNLYDDNVGNLSGSCEQFQYLIYLTDCHGVRRLYGGFFNVCENCQKSLAHGLQDIEEMEQEIITDIYCSIQPNPNNGTFTINTNIDPQEVISVQIFSMLGQSIYKQAGLPNNVIRLPLSASGVFYVEVITTTERFIRKMVVE